MLKIQGTDNVNSNLIDCINKNLKFNGKSINTLNTQTIELSIDDSNVEYECDYRLIVESTVHLSPSEYLTVGIGTCTNKGTQITVVALDNIQLQYKDFAGDSTSKYIPANTYIVLFWNGVGYIDTILNSSISVSEPLNKVVGNQWIVNESQL